MYSIYGTLAIVWLHSEMEGKGSDTLAFTVYTVACMYCMYCITRLYCMYSRAFVWHVACGLWFSMVAVA